MNAETMDRDEESGGKRPDFIAYNVRDGQDGKGHWNRVGAAWRHKDGQGYDIALDSLPVDGRVTLRELRDERVQNYGYERASRQQSRGQERPRERTRSRGR